MMRNLLFAEDFDAPAVSAPADPELEIEPFAPSIPPSLTQADIDLACAQAVAAAQAIWAQDVASLRLDALRSIVDGLDRLRDDTAAQVERVAEPLVGAVLGMIAAALPELCRTHGEREARALLRRVAPIVAQTGPLVVRANSGMLDGLREELSDLDEELFERIELRPANLPPGDLRLSWPDGTMTRDAAALRTAIADELSILGLDVSHPERTLTLAQ